MKRDRDVEDEGSLIRSNRAFGFSPESPCSKTTGFDILNLTLFSNSSDLSSDINNNDKNVNANTNDDGTCRVTSSSNTIINNNRNKDPDRFLPIANVGRIMKKVLPGNGKISKEAKETVQECVSEFISFVTGEASEKCQREKRKTINGDDILWAIMNLNFNNYVDPLRLYLNKYREIEEEKLNMPKQHRVEEFWPQEQKPADVPYNSMHSSSSTNAVPSIGPKDPTLSLNFSQSSGQSQEYHDDVNW